MPVLGRVDSLLRHTGLLAAIAVAGLLVGAAMLRSGNRHAAAYRSFERCVAEGRTPVCILRDGGSQAHGSAPSYRHNYENHLLVGWSAAGVGAVALLLMGGSVLRRRKRPATTADSAPMKAPVSWSHTKAAAVVLSAADDAAAVAAARVAQAERARSEEQAAVVRKLHPQPKKRSLPGGLTRP